MSFSYQRRIYLADTDAARVVYFAQLLSICHEAYEELLTQAGVDFGELVNNPELAIPIVHAEIDFQRPIFCGDELQIDVQIESITDNSFQVVYTVYKSGEQVAKGMTKHVAINPTTRRKTQLTAKIVEYFYRQPR